MVGLHRGNDPKLFETWNICRIEMLSVLDAPAEIGAIDLMFGEQALKQIEDLAVGPIADGMDAKLIIALQGEFGRSLQRAERQRVVAGAARQIVVRGQQPSPVRADRA